MADESSWEHWLARHTPALLLFARQQADGETDAQDLVQEAVVGCPAAVAGAAAALSLYMPAGQVPQVLSLPHTSYPVLEAQVA